MATFGVSLNNSLRPLGNTRRAGKERVVQNRFIIIRWSKRTTTTASYNADQVAWLVGHNQWESTHKGNTSGRRNCISCRIILAQKLSLDFLQKFSTVFSRTFEDKIVKGPTAFEDKYFGLFFRTNSQAKTLSPGRNNSTYYAISDAISSRCIAS